MSSEIYCSIIGNKKLLIVENYDKKLSCIEAQNSVGSSEAESKKQEVSQAAQKGIKNSTTNESGSLRKESLKEGFSSPATRKTRQTSGAKLFGFTNADKSSRSFVSSREVPSRKTPDLSNFQSLGSSAGVSGWINEIKGLYSKREWAPLMKVFAKVLGSTEYQSMTDAERVLLYRCASTAQCELGQFEGSIVTARKGLTYAAKDEDRFDLNLQQMKSAFRVGRYSLAISAGNEALEQGRKANVSGQLLRGVRKGIEKAISKN